MKLFSSTALCFLSVILSGCVMPPPGSSPGYNPPPPPRVLMPVDLSVREQALVPQIEEVLRRNRFEPAYRGDTDHLLEFTIDEGPVNVVTFIRLLDQGRVVALGEGRASGPPLIRRNQVLEDSFFQALRAFEGRLNTSAPSYPAYR